ncbi:Na(+)/H(+) antiporter NhaB like [Actinidia chinensis var. chinensis]|uniref:Na(+)/H(+) antiporter NhaB like n=1 Tax=Actinidia chinensis var. chinensis TaxID=1590841 RepID=A0A2R6QA05_ACTCC|nr:Na(+)/H(+) antiporter NhaB like [Actinidia chinensis var. chinensis]
MVSSGGDNVEENNVGEAIHIATDKGKSHHSRGDHSWDDSVDDVGKDGLEEIHLVGEGKGEGRPQKGTIPFGKKGIQIGEKPNRAQEEELDVSPMKKRNQTSTNVKKKRPLLTLDNKKKRPATKTTAKPKFTPTRAMIRDVPTFAALGEGTSVNLGIILGLESSAIDNPTMAKKLLQGVVLPADKEMVDKLEIDMAITWFFTPLVREMREKSITQQANTSSIQDEVTCAQSVAKDLESIVAELEADKQRSDAVMVVMGGSLRR